MVRTFQHQPEEIIKWRRDNSASVAQTAEHFGISTSTVKRAARLVEQPFRMSPSQIKELREKLEDWMHDLLTLQADLGPDSSLANTLAILNDLDKPDLHERVAKMLER